MREWIPPPPKTNVRSSVFKGSPVAGAFSKTMLLNADLSEDPACAASRCHDCPLRTTIVRLAHGRTTLPSIFGARVRPVAVGVPGIALIACVAAWQLSNIPGQLVHAGWPTVSCLILDSNTVSLQGPCPHSSFILRCSGRVSAV